MSYIVAMYLLGVYVVFTSLACYFKDEVEVSVASRRAIVLSSLGSWFVMEYIIHILVYPAHFEMCEMDSFHE